MHILLQKQFRLPTIALVLSQLCLFPPTSRAQNPTIDSLWAAVNQTENLVEKVDLFNYLAEEYKDIDLNEAVELCQRSLKVANKIDYPIGICYAYNILGTLYDDLGVGDSAYYYFDKALELAIEEEDQYALSVVKNNFGLHYLIGGNYTLALKYFQESLERIEEPLYFVDLKITYNNIGVIHEEQGNAEKAIEYYQKAGDFATANGDPLFGLLCYGYIAQMREDYDKAIDCYQQALVIYRKEEDPLHTGETLYYLGECFLGKKDYDLARQYLNESMEIYDGLERVSDVVEIYRTMAEVYEAEDRNDMALSLYHQALALSEQSEQITLLVPVYKALARQYARQKQFEKAYQYQLKYQELNDEIYDNDTKERIAQLENNYELAVNKAERERLEAEQAEKEAKVRQSNFLAIASTILSIMVAIIAFGFYRAGRQKKLLNKQLESKVRERTSEIEYVNQQLLESNQELERFTYIASHDLKEPLRNITSFINLIERKLEDRKDPELEEYMSYVTKNTRQMYNLIEDVLNFSRIAALDMREIDWVDLNLLMIDVQATLNGVIREKNAELIIEPLPQIRAHQTHVSMVFKNLIENGLKYNESDKPIVRVSYTEEKKWYCFSVSDNGIGIDPKYHDQIFEMFKRMTTRDKYEGTGIGLAICKKIVSKYGGVFKVESREGQGSTFSFTWPK
ncbi:MAG: tetratricopeptide repeat protein [Saprospiraceae bacterium]|nr:tetratricopeptide repeat protein [Lewinella sp.]